MNDSTDAQLSPQELANKLRIHAILISPLSAVLNQRGYDCGKLNEAIDELIAMSELLAADAKEAAA